MYLYSVRSFSSSRLPVQTEVTSQNMNAFIVYFFFCLREREREGGRGGNDGSRETGKLMSYFRKCARTVTHVGHCLSDR